MLGYSIPGNTRVIFFSDNSISHVPAGYFINLPNLDDLWLYDNVISNIDDHAFAQVPSVRMIDLGFNKLSVIRKNMFSGEQNLEILYLYNNEIDTIQPESFKNNTALIRLYLERNKISVIHNNMFSGAVNLQYLYLHNNEIWRIEPGSFIGNVALTSLRLNDNFLESLYECVFNTSNHPSNLNLYLYNNPLLCDKYLNWLKQADDTWITVSSASLTTCTGPDVLRGYDWDSITTHNLSAPGETNIAYLSHQ